MISKILRYKKECSKKEEYLNYREDMNARRKESPDEKNRRECEEILEDIRQEKKEISQLIWEIYEKVVIFCFVAYGIIIRFDFIIL